MAGMGKGLGNGRDGEGVAKGELVGGDWLL